MTQSATQTEQNNRTYFHTKKPDQNRTLERNTNSSISISRPYLLSIHYDALPPLLGNMAHLSLQENSNQSETEFDKIGKNNEIFGVKSIYAKQKVGAQHTKLATS